MSPVLYVGYDLPQRSACGKSCLEATPRSLPQFPSEKSRREDGAKLGYPRRCSLARNRASRRDCGPSIRHCQHQQLGRIDRYDGHGERTGEVAGELEKCHVDHFGRSAENRRRKRLFLTRSFLRHERGFDPIAHLQLLKNIAHMMLDRLFAEMELVPNFLVTSSHRQKLENLMLTFR